MKYLIIAAGMVIAIGYVCVVILTGLGKVAEGFIDANKQANVRRAERLAKRQKEKQEALAAADQAELDAYREDNPARIVDIPNADAFKRVFKILDDFTAAANSFRPQLSGSFDTRFKNHKFPSQAPKGPFLNCRQTSRSIALCSAVALSGDTECQRITGARLRNSCRFHAQSVSC